MNYYIQGDAAKADKIKAAFERLGYDTSFVQKLSASDNHILFTLPCDYRVHAFHMAYIEADILKRLVNIDPDYKELELPVEPKFKVGDWVVSPNGSQYLIAYIDKEDNRYLFEINEYIGEPMHYEDIQVVDSQYHLWAIADAKDGDVLSTNSIICIFKKLDKDGYYIISPCIYTVKGGLEVIDDENDSIGSCGFKPATKEDRKLLFRKMKEAGYEWDAKKKELRKIKSHYDIANFHEGMPVLVRDYDNSRWSYVQFSHYVGEECGFKFNACGIPYIQCIPFNDDTKHLLGTTDMCPEEYINW